MGTKYLKSQEPAKMYRTCRDRHTEHKLEGTTAQFNANTFTFCVHWTLRAIKQQRLRICGVCVCIEDRTDGSGNSAIIRARGRGENSGHEQYLPANESDYTISM